jgi:pilus assembly protein CpaC
MFRRDLFSFTFVTDRAGRGWIVRLAALWWCLLALLAVSATLAFAQRAAQTKTVLLNVGEDYVIANVAVDATPEVKFQTNPPPFTVSPLSPQELQVVAAARGAGLVRVKDGTGRIIEYRFVVHGVADAKDILVPGVSPPPMSEENLSVEAEKPAVMGPPSALDYGAGPAASSKAGDLGATFRTVEIPRATKPEASGAGSVAPDGRGSFGSSGFPMIGSQSIVPPSVAPNGKYVTDPPAVISKDGRTDCRTTPNGLPCGVVLLLAGTSRIFSFTAPISRVSVANPRIADIQMVNPKQLMIIGAQPGFTTLALWNIWGQVEEREVRVEKESHEQVLLNVVVAQINRTKLENQGIDLAAATNGISLSGLPGNVATPYSPIIPLNIFPTLGPSPLTGVASASTPLGLQGTMAPGGTLTPLLLSNKITYALATQNGPFQSNEFFQFLESHQLGRILAEPRLLANSGEEAKFLSGGEIPIVIAQALNTSIVFKQFGTSVIFVPTVIGDDEIQLVVKPEVSQPDYSQGVQMFGFNVPAFITQRAETQVRMKNGQTLIIAGLIQDNIQQQVNKVPYVGDLPFAGAFFRNTSYSRIKTELMITVTPQLVGPIPKGALIAKPTEQGGLTYTEVRTRSLVQPDPSRPRLW